MQYPKVLHKFLLHVLASIGSCTFSTLVFKQKEFDPFFEQFCPPPPCARRTCSLEVPKKRPKCEKNWIKMDMDAGQPVIRKAH